MKLLNIRDNMPCCLPHRKKFLMRDTFDVFHAVLSKMFRRFIMLLAKFKSNRLKKNIVHMVEVVGCTMRILIFAVISLQIFFWVGNTVEVDITI